MDYEEEQPVTDANRFLQPVDTELVLDDEPAEVQMEWIEVQGHCIAANRNSLYYMKLDTIPQTISAESAAVYEYTYADGRSRKIYSCEAPEDAGFWMNELKATEEHVYWVKTENGETILQQMNPVTGEVKEICRNPRGGGMTLSAGQHWILWYDDISYNEETALMVYDEREDSTYILQDHIVNSAVQGRPSVEGRIVSYLRMAGDAQELVRWDAVSHEIIESTGFSYEQEINWACGNEKYAVWIDSLPGSINGRNGQLCVYRDEDESLLRLNLPQGMDDIFSFNLMGDRVFINVSGYGLLIYDINDEKLQWPEYDHQGNVLIPTVISTCTETGETEAWYLAEVPGKEQGESRIVKIQ